MRALHGRPSGGTRRSTGATTAVRPSSASSPAPLPESCAVGGVGFVFSIVAAVVEKQSRFVRFHALQSLLLHGAGLAVLLVLWFLQVLLTIVGLGAVGMLVWLTQMVVVVALMAVSVIMLIKANT